jgi:hypothetical protein
MLHFSRDEGEDASVDDASMKLAEPALELVQDETVGIEGQIYVRTLLRASSSPVPFCAWQVVQDDVHLSIDRLRIDDLFQDGDKLLTSMSWGGLAEGLTGLWIQVPHIAGVFHGGGSYPARPDSCARVRAPRYLSGSSNDADKRS